MHSSLTTTSDGVVVVIFVEWCCTHDACDKINLRVEDVVLTNIFLKIIDIREDIIVAIADTEDVPLDTWQCHFDLPHAFPCPIFGTVGNITIHRYVLP